MIQNTARQFKPLGMYDTDYLPPSSGDIFPRQYPNDTQRLVLFRHAVAHHKRPRHWLAAQSHKAVHAFVKRHVERWRMDLPKRQWEKVARDAHRILKADLKSGKTEDGLRTFQAVRGVASGEARRAKNERRDTDIVRAIIAGQGVRSIARDYGLNPSTVCRIRDARL